MIDIVKSMRFLAFLFSMLLSNHAWSESIHLHQGWNLVSSSVQSDRSITAGETGNVFYFDQQQWNVLQTLALVEPHQGVWTFLDEESNLEIAGEQAAAQLLQISEGWLQSGVLGESTATGLVAKLEEEFTRLGHLEYVVTSVFSHQGGSWNHYDPVLQRGDLGELGSNDAVWVRVNGRYYVTEQTSVVEENLQQVAVSTAGVSENGRSVQILSQGSKGLVRVEDTETTISYAPFTNRTGSDSFTYQVTDVEGNSRTVDVAVTIANENDAPTVSGESASVYQGQSVEIGDLLENDSDGDGDELTISTVTEPPDHGTLTVDGTHYSYLADSDYQGEDQFTYTVTDGNGGSAQGTVQILVTVENQTYDVSGTIRVSPGTLYDGDVNHPNAPCSYNGAKSQEVAQLLTNPSTVGGYARTPSDDVGTTGRGRGGNQDLCNGAAGGLDDWWDVYRVTLVAGQQVGLYMGADTRSNDLDLVLTDENNENVQVSLGVSETESVTVPADGDYYILVTPFSGATNYVLTVGQSSSGSSFSTASVNLNSDFVSGEVILRQSREVGMGRRLVEQVDQFGLTRLSGDPAQRSARYNVDFGAAGRKTFRQRQDQVDQISQLVGFDEAQKEKLQTLYMIKELQQDPAIEYAEPNYILQPQTSVEPDDQHFDKQWHYPMINLPLAWGVSTAENEPVVAVIDTGVLLNHPDFDGRLVDGYDFISDTESAGDGDGYDADPDDVGDGNVNEGGTRSSSFHGTHVAGTIAASSNNGVGIAGVAWGAKIMPLRALGKSGGTSYDIEQAMRFAGGLSNDSGAVPARIADVVNMSLGGPGYSSSNQEVVNSLREQGVIVVAAAGNSASSAPFYPASYDGVISVSSVGYNSSSLAPYSNYGAFIDIAAPGGDTSQDANGDGFPDGVLSTMGTDAGEYVFGFLQGTSMASPHVAGVAALMRSVNPDLTPDLLDSLISNGDLSHDLGDQGWDNQYGHGLVDAYKAVIAASQITGSTTDEVEVQAVLTVRPAVANFGMSSDSLSIDLSNSTGGELDVTTVESSADWLQVQAVDEVTEDGLGGYTLTVNRELLALGPHSTTLQIESTAGNITLPVIVQKVDTNISGDAGHHTVVLIAADSYQVINSIELDVEDGEYRYSFSGVPAGEYLIVAGTDSNYDNVICDAGEACGAYPFYEPGNLNPVMINQDRTFDFDTSFDIRVRSSAASTGVVEQSVVPFEGFQVASESP